MPYFWWNFIEIFTYNIFFMKKIYLFLGLLLFTVMGAFAQNTCSYVFYLHDGYGDGWNNAKINVKQGNTVVQSVTFTT